MKKFILTSACCLLSLISFSACAQYSYFFRDTAAAHFTKEDAEIYKHAQYDALDHSKDGRKTSWSNPQTGAHGYFIPEKTRKEKGMTCRDLSVFNFAEHRSGKSSWKFCKIHNEWKIV